MVGLKDVEDSKAAALANVREREEGGKHQSPTCSRPIIPDKDTNEFMRIFYPIYDS